MPQTRFVLSKAMALGLSVIVCINKIDRPGARPTQVIDEVLELLMDLGANDEQLDCPFVFASAKSGIATLDLGSPGVSMKPLFETIIEHIPAPSGDPEAPTQVLISTIDYNDYVGRIGEKMLLQIGNKYSAFYSYPIFQRDSTLLARTKRYLLNMARRKKQNKK